MELKELNKRNLNELNKKQLTKFNYLDQLIFDLKNREITTELINLINGKIDFINDFSGSEKDYIKQLKKATASILQLLGEELELVAKHHYQNQWTAYGMLAGVIFSTIFTQLGYSETWSSIGMGIPMGLLFGMLAGKNRDEKALKEGKQLNV